MNTIILVNIFRYYSLPNLKGTTLDVGTVTGQRQYQYQSHPRDEEKRIAYTRGRDRSIDKSGREGKLYWYPMIYKHIELNSC